MTSLGTWSVVQQIYKYNQTHEPVDAVKEPISQDPSLGCSMCTISCIKIAVAAGGGVVVAAAAVV